MKNFKFYLPSLESLYSFGLVDPVDSIFEFMHQELKNGNSVTLEKQNNPTENSNTILFQDSSELKKFYNEFAKNNCPPLNRLLEQRHRAKYKTE